MSKPLKAISYAAGAFIDRAIGQVAQEGGECEVFYAGSVASQK